MVKINKNADNKFTQRAIKKLAKKPRTIPNDKASSDDILPVTIGLCCVRVIIESISLSYHILIAAAEPAPIVIQSIAVTPISECICPGASTNPQKLVNTTSDITLGFISAI
jgi:hypothetical protein